MDQDRYLSIKRKEAELSGKKADLLEILDLDADENEASQSIKEKVTQILGDDEEEPEDPEKISNPIQGIDF